MSSPSLVDAPADRPGGIDPRQETPPVTVAGSSPGFRSRRGQSPLSCFLRWVFRHQIMKTTNAENDGKANDRQFDILMSEYPVDASEIAFLQGVRHGLLKARVYTVPDSALRAKVDELITEASANIETLEAVFRHQTSLWSRVNIGSPCPPSRSASGPSPPLSTSRSSSPSPSPSPALTAGCKPSFDSVPSSLVTPPSPSSSSHSNRFESG